MTDIRNEFSADEEKSMRVARRGSYADLPASHRIEDRREETAEPSDTDRLLSFKRRAKFTMSPNQSDLTPPSQSAQDARNAAAVAMRNTRAMPTAMRVGGD